MWGGIGVYSLFPSSLVGSPCSYFSLFVAVTTTHPKAYLGGGISKVNGNRAEVSLRPESKIMGKDLQASVNGEVLLDLSIRITQNEPSGYRASPFGLLMLDREGYFSHIFRRAARETLLPMPKRLVLVIDISASMLSKPCGACQTKKIDQAKAAVRAILQKLSDVDEFAILAFGSSTQVASNKRITK